MTDHRVGLILTISRKMRINISVEAKSRALAIKHAISVVKADIAKSRFAGVDLVDAGLTEHEPERITRIKVED